MSGHYNTNDMPTAEQPKHIMDIGVLARGSRVCLYGTGEFGRKVLAYIRQHRPDIDVPFLVDTYRSEKCFGLEVVPPSQLAHARKGQFDAVVVTSTFHDEITATLAGMIQEPVYVASLNLLVIGKLLGEFVDTKDGRYDYALIELTTRCNMQCEFCGHKLVPASHRRDMDFDFFTSIIDQIAANNITRTIHLYGLGEPLLYPRLDEAISYCRSRDLQPTLLTNGILLTPERYDRLIKSGLDHLHISFHNLSPESFSYRYASGKIPYHKYRENLFSVLDYHAAHNIAPKLIMLLMFSRDAWISSELWDFAGIRNDTRNARSLFRAFLNEAQKITSRHGLELLLDEDRFVDAVEAMHIDNSHALQELPLFGNVSIKFNTLIPLEHSAMQQLVKERIQNYRIEPVHHGTCSMLQALRITIDGSIMFCCRAPLLKKEFIRDRIGRITPDTPLVSILHTRRYRDMLQGFRKSIVVENSCAECLGRYVPNRNVSLSS